MAQLTAENGALTAERDALLQHITEFTAERDALKAATASEPAARLTPTAPED